MNKFMIGMYGRFNENKYIRDFKDNFYGIEACLFEDEKDIEKLVYKLKNNSIKLGIHFPLRKKISRLRDAQFLSLDKEKREDAYKYIEEVLDYINKMDIKCEYILFHYPKPVILKSDFDMTNWRFADKSEYVYEEDYTSERFKLYSEALFKWLSKKSFEYNFVPVLEFDALNKYICDDNFLESLLDKYKRIRICLDTGRLHLQSKLDSSFNAKEIIKRFAKYTEVMHLWNAKVSGNLENSHFPALQNLKVEDGWAPIKDYLRIIKGENRKVKIMFEHRSDLISDEELDNCYEWVKSILED